MTTSIPEPITKLDKQYIDIVEEAAEKEENLDIPNRTLDHAVFLTQKLILKAKNNIKILTGELGSPYYDRIKDDLQFAVDKFKPSGGKIKVIVWEQDAPINEIFSSFIRNNNDVIEVRKAAQNTTINHFLVSDSKRYRFEEIHSKQDLIDQKVKGTANFGNPEKASILNEVFDTIWNGLNAAP